MADLIERFEMTCTTGGSNKFYTVELQMVEDGVALQVIYGAIGGASKASIKGRGDLTSMRKDAGKLLKEKLAKGYVLQSHYMMGDEHSGDANGNGDGDGAKSESSPAMSFGGAGLAPQAGIRTGFDPMLLTAMGLEDEFPAFVERCRNRLAGLTHVVQIKYDGERRCLSFKDDGSVQASNRRGFEVMSPAWAGAARSVLTAALIRSVTLDGEMVGETFVAFDVLEMNGEDLRPRIFEERLTFLRQVSQALNGAPAGLPFLVAQTYTLAEAVSSLKDWQARGEEGFVIRSVLEPYTPGRASHALKVKFWNTATVRCLAVEGEEGDYRTMKMGVVCQDAGMLGAGKVTLPPKVASPSIGSLVEVRYLYAFDLRAGGSLFQPTFLRVRDDLDRHAPGVDSIEQIVCRAEPGSNLGLSGRVIGDVDFRDAA